VPERNDFTGNEELRRDLLYRLKRIEGQIRGIQKMIENNRGCGDIIIQLAAVKAAVNQVGVSILACHLAECIKDGMANGKDVKSALAEFMPMFKKFS